MKVVKKIKLEVDIKDPRLEASLDGQTIAVYGQSNSLILAKINNQGDIAVMSSQVPIRSILAIKFTLDQDIIMLGNDHTIYAVAAPDRNMVIALFNQDS